MNITDDMVERAAKALFEASIGYKSGLHHWPGDTPRPVIAKYAQPDDVTRPADHPLAPDMGRGPDRLRVLARVVLDAAAKGDTP